MLRSRPVSQDPLSKRGIDALERLTVGSGPAPHFREEGGRLGRQWLFAPERQARLWSHLQPEARTGVLFLFLHPAFVLLKF